MQLLPYPVVTTLAALVALIALLPLAFVVAVLVQVGWEAAAAMIIRPRVGELLVNTLLLEGLTIPLAITLGVALAWLTERTDLPGRRLWAWLAVAPLAVPAFVHSYAWNGIAPTFHGLPAAVLISVLAYAPFLYLPVAAQLRRLDPAIEDAAASLGLPPWRVFFLATLPQLRLAIAGGALLIGLHLLAEFGLYAMIRFDTFTTAIMDQFQSSYNAPAANLLGVVLVACCFVVMGIEQFARGHERYARLGPGAARMLVPRHLGGMTIPCLLLVAAVAVLALGVPALTLGRWLVAGGGAAWTVAVGAALATTAGLAIVGGTITTLIVTPMAWLSVRAPGRLQRGIEAAYNYVGALPGVVVALALVTITVRVAMPLYQTAATLILAYVILFLPRALVGLRTSIAQAPVELEWAAMALGRTPFQAVRQVTLRLAAPGAAVSVALTALAITTELTATLMLAPSGTHTLATEFWQSTSELDYAAAAPYALMMVIASLPMTVLLHTQSKRMAGR